MKLHSKEDQQLKLEMVFQITKLTYTFIEETKTKPQHTLE